MGRAAGPLIALTLLMAAAGCEQVRAWFGGGKGQGESAATPTTQAVAPAPPAVAPTEILATVNGVPISQADMELRVQEFKALTQNVGQPWTALTEEQLKAGLDELISGELMSQAAVQRGLDRSQQTQERWGFARRAFLAQEWLRWNQERLDVGSAEVEQFYEQNKPGFREPQRRRLRQLVVASEDQAKQALAQLLSGSVEFASLAQQISLAPTAANGGLMSDWVMRAGDKAFAFATEADAQTAGVISLDPALEAAAFVIDQVNGLSNHVKGPDNQFHIFQLVERKEEQQRALTEVWDQVKNFLLIQKLQASVDGLRAAATIERFPERLEGVTQ